MPLTNGSNLIKGTSGNKADVTLNNELKTLPTGIGLPQGATAYNDSEGFSTARNKIEYTVPVGKELHITGWTSTLWEGKMQLELQIDGTTVDGAGLNEDGSTFAERSVSTEVPIATANAGEEVRWRRVSGDSGKPWFCSVQGYLEDV